MKIILTLLIVCFCAFKNYAQPLADQYTDSATVIIVGAGIAGLSAANYLKEKGIDCIILDAKGRIGWRIHTDTSLGFPLDLGASWIHGPKGNPITPLLEAAGATTYITNDNNVEVYDIDGKKYKEALMDRNEKEFEQLLTLIKRSGTFTSSFESVFNSNYADYSTDRFWKYMLSAYLEFDTGGDISRLSSKFFYDDKDYIGKDVMITNGYSRLIDHLKDSIDIRTDQRVNTIDYSRDFTIVASQNMFYKSKYVIVTIPLGVLKKKNIAYKPPLPHAKQEGIAKLDMGTVNKFVLVWDTVFWNIELDYIGFTPEEKGKFNLFLNLKKTNNVNALMTFSFGNYSKVAESKSDSVIIKEIMNHLKIIYGENIPAPISFKRTNWGSDKNHYGSYSHATRGIKTNVFELLSEEVNDKLFFAGEHTSWDYRGTVHGAYKTGIREAKKIIRLTE